MPYLWKNNASIYYILHQDNEPVHNNFSVKPFLADKRISVLEHLPYSIFSIFGLPFITNKKICLRGLIFHEGEGRSSGPI